MEHRTARLITEVCSELTRMLVDDGKLIEGGWTTLRMVALPADAPEAQVRELRKAFFLGAHHLWLSLYEIPEQDKGPAASDKEMARLEQIQNELEAFRLEHCTPHRAGRA